jgi:rhodanese-related sulfurtransferase
MASVPETVSVEDLLAQARSTLRRLTPAEAYDRHLGGALIVDIRPLEQRRGDGEISNAHVVARNILEWRLDPGCEHRDPALAVTDRQLILICNEGYQSSLAAATLRRFGVDATDVIGGAQGWLADGLPVERPVVP